MRFQLKSDIYPIPAILNACYRFVDAVYIFIDSDRTGKKISVSFKPKQKGSNKQLGLLKSQFMNELLHSALRYELSTNNRKIREYIIGNALYSNINASSSLAQRQGLEYRDDPLGIAKSWEKSRKKHAVPKV